MYHLHAANDCRHQLLVDRNYSPAYHYWRTFHAVLLLYVMEKRSIFGELPKISQRKYKEENRMGRRHPALLYSVICHLLVDS